MLGATIFCTESDWLLPIKYVLFSGAFVLVTSKFNKLASLNIVATSPISYAPLVALRFNSLLFCLIAKMPFSSLSSIYFTKPLPSASW